MRSFIAVLLLCLLAPAYVDAKPSQYPVDGFSGDRYVRVAQGGGMGPDVVKAIKKRSGAKPRHPTPHKQPRRRPPPGIIAPLTLAGGFTREVVATVIGGRPAGCPSRAWCGCWLASHLGIRDRSLWLARNWAHVGSSAGGPRVGAIVVWRNHVGKITAVDGHRIRVVSGNDGHRVRDRWRTTAGVIAFRVAG